MCFECFIYVFRTFHLCVSNVSFMCFECFIYVFRMFHLCVSNVSFMCFERFIYVFGTFPLCISNVFFVCFYVIFNKTFHAWQNGKIRSQYKTTDGTVILYLSNNSKLDEYRVAFKDDTDVCIVLDDVNGTHTTSIPWHVFLHVGRYIIIIIVNIYSLYLLYVM